MNLSGAALSRVNLKIITELHKVSKALAVKDASIWGPDSEASTRLNWIDLPKNSRELLPQLDSLAAWARSKNAKHFVLCGMGGSSLAAEVIAATFNKDLVVLDSTHPDQIAEALPKNLAHSIIIIGSKSGTTIETTSHFKFFKEQFIKAGLNPSDHFVIVTDPATPLDIEAKASGLRVINADPLVGGRFSALSAFGLVPAALLGLDVSVLLDDAEALQSTFESEDSIATKIASLLYTESDQFVEFSDFQSNTPGLSDWIEQLIAESTGKQHKGRLPVVISKPQESSNIFSIGFADGKYDLSVRASLGEQFILWEWVTALLCYLLKVDPFNQPNVAESKERTGAILSQIGNKQFIYPTPILEKDDFAIYSNEQTHSLQRFFESSSSYLSLMAYLPKNQDNSLMELRSFLSNKLGKPVTFGWGPRFLHSTGQFHKGGQPNGSFLQITANPSKDLAIPGEKFTFAELLMAQALGDASALAERNLPVIRIHLKKNNLDLQKLLQSI